MVDERLDLARGLGHAEDLGQQFLDETGVRLLLEGSIKRKDRARALQAISNEVELFHGVQILQVHLDGGTIWCLAHPGIEILAFSCFEEQDVVAVVQFGKLVELVQLGLGIQLCFLPAVGPGTC